MPEQQTTDELVRLRRKVWVRLQRLSIGLIGRCPPCWEWRDPKDYLTAMGFRTVDHCSERELKLMLVFLDHWIDCLPVSADAYWSDPDDGDR